MSGCVNRYPVRAGQSGVVLITVLLMVVLATVVAVSMLDAAQIAAARGANLRASDAAHLRLLAAEEQARFALAATASGAVTSDVDGVPVEAVIEDMQSRFNLNNLVRHGVVSEPDLAQFRRLLAVLRLDPALADPVVDWLDADSIPRGALGAEDAQYRQRTPPMLAANHAMLSTSELRVLPGFTPEVMAVLEPLVAALPGPTPVNVNTAPVEVLASLAEGLDARALDGLIAQRAGQPFTRIEQFSGHPALGGRAVPAAAAAVRSHFFVLRTRTLEGRIGARLTSLLQRDDTGRVRVLARSRADL